MRFPISVKVTFFLISMFLFLSILDIAQAILLPLIYALIITILLGPAVRFLVVRRFNRALAVGLILFCTIAIVLIIVSLLSTQIGRLSDAAPMLSAKFTEFFEESIKSFSSYFDIREEKVNEWIANLKSEAAANSTRMIGTTLSAVSGLLSTVFLTPVYVFMLLFYQPHLILFLNKLFGESNGSNISGLLANTKSIIQ
jgi:predicted PurR-regulated permease PerM